MNPTRQKLLIASLLALLVFWSGYAILKHRRVALPIATVAQLEDRASIPAAPAPSRAMETDSIAEKTVQAASSNSPQNTLSGEMANAAEPSFKPQIIQSATVALKVKMLRNAMTSLENLTLQSHGMITNQSLSLAGESSEYRSGSLEVRVPADRLPGFLNDLNGLGNLQSQQINSTDVSTEMVDSEARVRNLKAEEAALQAIMQRAGKIPDVLEVSRELTRVRGEIEQLQSRLAFLKQQVAYATVSLSLSEVAVSSPVDAKPGMLNILGNAFKQASGSLYDLVLMGLQAGVWLLAFFIPVTLAIGASAVLVWRFVLVRLLAYVAQHAVRVHHRFRPNNG